MGAEVPCRSRQSADQQQSSTFSALPPSAPMFQRKGSKVQPNCQTQEHLRNYRQGFLGLISRLPLRTSILFKSANGSNISGKEQVRNSPPPESSFLLLILFATPPKPPPNAPGALWSIPPGLKTPPPKEPIFPSDPLKAPPSPRVNPALRRMGRPFVACSPVVFVWFNCRRVESAG